MPRERRSTRRHPAGREEIHMELHWETPQFEEIGVAPEVTMYVAQMDD